MSFSEVALESNHDDFDARGALSNLVDPLTSANVRIARLTFETAFSKDTAESTYRQVGHEPARTEKQIMTTCVSA